MHPKCFKSLSNGERCSAPAIRGSRFCRHHDPQLLKKDGGEESGENEPLVLPPLLDKPSMFVAINQVAQALAAGSIKRSVATTLLLAIKMANHLLTEIVEAGLELDPSMMPVGPRLAQGIDRKALLELDELVDLMQNGSPDQFREHYLAQQKNHAAQSKPQSRPQSAPAAAPQAIALAASRNPQKPAQAFSISDSPTDRFVAEIMAQAHEMLAKAPRPDPLLTHI